MQPIQQRMKTANYPIMLGGEGDTTGMPRIVTDFGRITVLLGSNGTGKSKALSQIRSMGSSFGSSRPVVYIEGGRVITPPVAVQSTDQESYNLFRNHQIAIQNFEGRRGQPIASRNKDVFYVLARRSDTSKVEHSDAVLAWQKTGSVGPCPVKSEDPQEILHSMFNDVFPEITLSIAQDNDRTFQATKGTSQYSVTQLSDGERQVLFVLADIALTAKPESLIVVDEPELNLNAHLAGRLWDAIESRLPEAVFVYATHNVSFAMRPSIECVIALGGRRELAVEIDTVSNLDPNEARELLGAIPAILAAPAALGVEGTDQSFDRDFYAWLLGRTDVAVVPLGGCEDVQAAVSRRGMWDKLAPSICLAGVIDRDYRSDQTLSNAPDSCCILDFHEAESYLCQPEILIAVAEKLGLVASIPTEAKVAQEIVAYFDGTLMRTAINRLNHRARIRLNVSLGAAAARSDLDSVRTQIATEARSEASKAEQYVGETVALKIFNEEYERCTNARDSANIPEILRLCQGKQLLRILAPLAGCNNESMYVRAVYKHLDLDSFTSLKGLRVELEGALAPRVEPEILIAPTETVQP